MLKFDIYYGGSMLARWLIIFSILLLSAGCDELAHLSDPPKQLVVQVGKSSNVRDIERILKMRFAEYPAAVFSSVKSKTVQDRIIFTFEKGAPVREIVDFFVSHKGRLVGRTEKGDIWFSDKDIVSASVKYAENSNFLTFTLLEVAAQRIGQLSEHNIGKVLIVDFDGERLVTAKVMAKLGKRFQVDVNKDAKELLLIAAILRSEVLPEKVTVLKNEI